MPKGNPSAYSSPEELISSMMEAGESPSAIAAALRDSGMLMVVEAEMEMPEGVESVEGEEPIPGESDMPPMSGMRPSDARMRAAELAISEIPIPE